MTHKEDSLTRVLSIYPTTIGFGYAVFEGASNPIDWGVKSTKDNKNESCLEKIERLIDFYSPDVVVSEDYQGEKSNRCKRIEELIDGITELCSTKNQKLKKYSRLTMYGTFDSFGAFTKHEIAQAIARWYPSLEPYLPPPRKPWKSEDYRMGIFDSIAIVMTYFHVDE